MPTEVISPEVECLKLKAAINENWRLSQKAAKDAIERALLTGELLLKWKELLTHGKFEVFVEKHFEGSLRTARIYMQAAKGLKELPKTAATAVLNTEDSLAGLISRLKKDTVELPVVQAGTKMKATLAAISGQDESDSISEKGKLAGATTSSDSTPPQSEPANGEAADSSGEDERTDSTGQDAPQETDPRPPRSGTEKPGNGYVGKCPSCASSKWTAEGNCAKCGQPFGEPVGDRTEGEDHVGTMRSKTSKTCEALMRALDDLNRLSPRAGAHKQSIELCKTILKTVKGWK